MVSAATAPAAPIATGTHPDVTTTPLKRIRTTARRMNPSIFGEYSVGESRENPSKPPSHLQKNRNFQCHPSIGVFPCQLHVTSRKSDLSPGNSQVIPKTYPHEICMLRRIFLVRTGQICDLLLTGKARKQEAGAKDPSGAERNSSELVSGQGSEGSRGRAGKRWRLLGGEAARF